MCLLAYYGKLEVSPQTGEPDHTKVTRDAQYGRMATGKGGEEMEGADLGAERRRWRRRSRRCRRIDDPRRRRRCQRRCRRRCDRRDR